MFITYLNAKINTLGAAMVLVFGLFLFSIQDVVIKYFSDNHSVLQVVFFRGLIAMALILACLKIFKLKIPLFSSRPRLMWARGLAGFSSYLFFYLAIAAMPLAEVVAITFTMPLFVTAMSALVLGEKVGLRRWSAVLVGFIGVLFIVSPQGDIDFLAVLFSFAGAFTYALQTILTRFLQPHDEPLTIAFNALFIFTFMGALLTLALFSGLVSIPNGHPSLAFLGRDWTTLSSTDITFLLVIGLIAAIGFYCLSKAYCMSEASAIAPFEFTYILWAILFGYIFWSEVPSFSTLFGVTILISSSLFIWYRERQLARLAELTTATVCS